MADTMLVRRTTRWLIAGVLLCLTHMAPSTSGAPRTWNGGGDGSNWSDPLNWGGTVPQAGDDTTIISGASVVLSNSTAELGSFAITNATLTFKNWTTALRATNVFLHNGASLTHSVCDTNAAIDNTNRVYILCGNLTLSAGASINADSKGHRGGDATILQGRGPGAGINMSGAGYGGKGAHYYPWQSEDKAGDPYGSTAAPSHPGSGGAKGDGNGYPGGGAIWIDATNHVIINGIVTANGGGSGGYMYGAGGSGGSVYISCKTLAGTNGNVSVTGGSSVNAWWYNKGAGGGGRIAVIFDRPAQSNLNMIARPSVVFNANRGSASPRIAYSGTLYFSGSEVLPEVLKGGIVTNVTSWTPGNLIVEDGMSGLREVTLTVLTNMTLRSSAVLEMSLSNKLFTVGGDLVMTNGADLYIWSGPTNAVWTNYGAMVSITGCLWIGSGSYIYPYSDPINGGSCLFRMSNLTMTAGSFINADARGFAGGSASHGYGPGGGENAYSGGGYGGLGQGARSGYAETYGSSNAPIHPGSGGGGTGGAGGGLVRLEIIDSATLNGTITANGGTQTYGGSGGGVFIKALAFTETYGTIRANGGSGSSKGGGGGRIALVDWVSNQFDGTLSAVGGGSAADGTIVRIMNPAYDVTLSVTPDPLRHGVSSPYDYGEYALFSDIVVTNTMTSPVEQTNGMRYICYRSTLSDSSGIVSNWSGTVATFAMTTNYTLTWHWTNQYYLLSTCGLNGGLQPDRTDWYTNGVQVQITAVASNTYQFLKWSGTGVPTGNETNNPLTLTMDQTRTVHAVFVSDTPTTRTWGGIGEWTSDTNWTPSGVPGNQDTIIIGPGTCALPFAAQMASLTINSGGTLAQRYWLSSLTAPNVTIQAGGILTHYICSTNIDIVNTSRVHVICSNLTVDAGGMIDVNYKGYAGAFEGKGYGPGGGRAGNANYSCGGSGYGGKGGRGHTSHGNNYGGPAYGSPYNADQPGSGGAGSSGTRSGTGGDGGGCVRVDATGTVTVDGTIRANGGNGQAIWSGGGSGGGIRISCQTFDGNGTIEAKGGNKLGESGGGGGGRIAIIYSPSAQATVTPRPTVTYSVIHATSYQTDDLDVGTIFMTDSKLLTETLSDVLLSECYVYGVQSWAPSYIALTNGIVKMKETGLQLTVTNDITIDTGGRLDVDISNWEMIVGRITLTNGGVLVLRSGPTNAVWPLYGSSVKVRQDLLIGSGSTLTTRSNPTNGGSIRFEPGNLRVDGTFSANAAGFGGSARTSTRGWGTGSGKGYNNSAGGAGYGGVGGQGNHGVNGWGGPIYGSSNAPIDPGSQGGCLTSKDYIGGYGGGLIWIDTYETDGDVIVNGVITANGGTRLAGNGGSGSGGGIYIRCVDFGGGGTLTANGANVVGEGGGGGGGRIAVWRVYHTFSGTATATNGSGTLARQGQPGTVYWGALLNRGTVFIFR